MLWDLKHTIYQDTSTSYLNSFLCLVCEHRDRCESAQMMQSFTHSQGW